MHSLLAAHVGGGNILRFASAMAHIVQNDRSHITAAVCASCIAFDMMTVQSLSVTGQTS